MSNRLTPAFHPDLRSMANARILSDPALAHPPLPDAEGPTLSVEQLGADPFVAFEGWMQEAAERSGMRYPNAVTLATVDGEGDPDARIVLLKGVDARGFLFFTNYDSAKGRALLEHPRGALTFYWDGMGRQVRARGPVEPLPAAESDAYFQSRPRLSRLGAWASLQSQELEGRAVLEARLADVERQYPGEDIPRPPHWGGFVLRATRVEFWQEGPFRLHDRVRYARDLNAPLSGWTPVRLYP
jgi:pyridoxamine 5'-phosphate oxidase